MGSLDKKRGSVLLCLMEAKAEAEMLALGLGNIGLAKRRLEQAREEATVRAMTYVVELIDYAAKALDRGEYKKAAELIEHIIELPVV